MTTRSTDALVDIYQALERSGQYPSLRRSGIVGDLRHRINGGYHISCEDQPSSNYSRQAPADRRGRVDIARAINIGLNPADMRKLTTRLMNACKANHANPASEPRIEPLRGFLGTLDNRRVIGWNRVATGNGSRSHVGYITGEGSHLWHGHLEIFTDYADDPAKTAGIAAILLGVPIHPLPPPEEDMPTAKEVADAILTARVGTGALNDWTVRHLIDWTARSTRTQGQALAKILAKLVEDDPGQAELAADLEAIRAQLAAQEDDAEPPASPRP